MTGLVGRLLALGLSALLVACESRPAPQHPAPPASPAPIPKPIPVGQSADEAPDTAAVFAADTLPHQFLGVYVCTPMSAQDIVPAAGPVPAGYRVYSLRGGRAPHEPFADYHDTHPLAAGGQVGPLGVQLRYREIRQLYPSNDPDDFGRECGTMVAAHQLNQWKYDTRYTYCPQLRGPAALVDSLNRALWKRYYTNVAELLLTEGTSPEAWTAAPGARRQFDDESADSPALWHTDYKLVDTLSSFRYFPTDMQLTSLGPHGQILTLDDYQYTLEEEQLRWNACGPDRLRAHYSLQRHAWVKLLDVVRPALQARVMEAVVQAENARRRRHQLPPLSAKAAKEENEDSRLWPAQFNYFSEVDWSFTPHGLLLHSCYASGHWGEYAHETLVLVPYSVLAAYLR